MTWGSLSDPQEDKWQLIHPGRSGEVCLEAALFLTVKALNVAVDLWMVCHGNEVPHRVDSGNFDDPVCILGQSVNVVCVRAHQYLEDVGQEFRQKEGLEHVDGVSFQ